VLGTTVSSQASDPVLVDGYINSNPSKGTNQLF